MTRAAARSLAAAIRAGARRHADERGPGRHRATVLRWTNEDAFALDVQGADLTLDEGDVTVTQAVRDYDARVGIVAGDVLVLLELGDHDYSAVAVESDTEGA